MDLYYSPASSGSRAIQMLAEALGLTLNLKPLNVMQQEQMTPEFIKLNPQHTIPTLVDGDFSIWESRVILSYLASKYGKDDSLYPKDPQARAVVDQRMYFDLGTLYQKFHAWIAEKFFKKHDDPEKFNALLSAIEMFNTLLEGHEFAAGNHLTIADYTLVASISTYETIGIDMNKYPNVNRWFQKCKSIIPGYEINERGLETMKEMMKKFEEAK